MQQSDYYTIEKSNGVATIWLDQKGEKINKISPEVINLFDGLAKTLEADNEIKAAVLISRKKDFIAGADIDAFLEVKKPGDFKPITEKGHQILNSMATSSKPIVAAIHGACLGAGLEIALACHARIASDDRGTKMALPEVQLGLLPGGGGTQRLPRLVGLQNALTMMTTGKNIFARPAKKMGLVDQVVHVSKLHKAASKLALQLTKAPLKRKVKKSMMQKFLDNTSMGRNLVFKKARQMAAKATQGNYPAIPKIFDCVEIGLKQGMTAGLAAEATKFEELILSPESRQLIGIFFNMTDKKKNPMADLAKPIHRIAMLGAGFMGAGIAEVSIVKGIDVLLKDIKQETIQSAQKTIWKSLAKKLKRKSLRKTEAEQLINKVHGQLDYKNFDTVDMVVEAVFEDVGLKQKVLAECEANTHDQCIFASNTSALPISKIAAKAKRPELILGLHYFSPVPKMPLLEIVKTPQTADWVVATGLEFGIRQGKTCIVVNDAPGFYTTRILAAFLNEALLMLEEGADALVLDRALKKWGFPVGPVTLMDEVGIDVGAHIMEGDIIEQVQLREDVKIAEGLKHMAKAGYKGRKNGKGFFLYDAKTGKKLKGQINKDMYRFFGGENRKTFPLEEMQMRLGMAMVNEAVISYEDRIIENPTDGDVGAIFGLGFPPFRGGPFKYIDGLGASKVVEIMNQLKAQHGGRFKPAKMLVNMAEEGKTFYS